MPKAKVLLGVTGSVAAIKVPELVEQLKGASEVEVGCRGAGVPKQTLRSTNF